MPRVLTKLKIDEISAVDAAANGGAKVTLYKRNNEADMATDRLVEVCKSINVGDVTPPSEHELVSEIQKLANNKRLPGETSAAAFRRIYEAQDDDGLTLRKAVQVCKRAAGFPV
jgi:hypothetical protein